MHCCAMLLFVGGILDLQGGLCEPTIDMPWVVWVVEGGRKSAPPYEIVTI